MDLHAIEASRLRVDGSPREVPDDAGDLIPRSRGVSYGTSSPSRVLCSPLMGIADGANGALPSGCSDECEKRPVCQIWLTIRPPLAWTASVTRLIARKLAENRRVLCAAPAYLDRRGRPWRVEDLVHHDCITLSGIPYWPFVVAGRDRLVRVAGRFSSNSVEGTHEACVGGVGLALLSTWDVVAELSDGKLVSIDLNEPVAQERAIWAVYPKARHTLPKLHVFLSRLQERLRI